MPSALTPLRILVVDDELDTAQSMAYVLMDMGHQVMFTNNGDSAVEIARRFRPEIAFVDIVLPDIEGGNLAMELREASGVRGLRVFAITGYPEELRRGEGSGFDGWYLKPVQPEILWTLLGDLKAGSIPQPS